MPTGYVCQLFYGGGGLLLYQNSVGDSKQRLPFAPASHQRSLRIGQTVSFSLSQQAKGREEAVDLQIVERGVHSVRGPRVGDEQSQADAGPGQPDRAWRIRRLQRQISRFHNAEQDEKRRMLREAQESVTALLAAEELDGDAICRWVSRLAAWLSAPRSIGSASGEAMEPSTSDDLQNLVRKLLLACLRHLDLTDDATYRAVEAALVHITQLLQKKSDFSSLSSGRAGKLAVKQWRKLRSLLPAAAWNPMELTAAKRNASHSPSERTRRTKIVRRLTKDRAIVGVNSMYRPNDRVRSLPMVSMTETHVPLKCSQCTARITTSWVWKHPRTGEVYALVPFNGHAACKKVLGKRCPWLSLNGTLTLLDKFSHLDFCHHNRRKSICKECGGEEICPHHRQWSRLLKHTLELRHEHRAQCLQHEHELVLESVRMQLEAHVPWPWPLRGMASRSGFKTSRRSVKSCYSKPPKPWRASCSRWAEGRAAPGASAAQANAAELLGGAWGSKWCMAWVMWRSRLPRCAPPPGRASPGADRLLRRLHHETQRALLARAAPRGGILDLGAAGAEHVVDARVGGDPVGWMVGWLVGWLDGWLDAWLVG
eukprot:Skav214603  [mRNA]  locus=scaffold57:871237:879493:- [translate_table: standard]